MKTRVITEATCNLQELFPEHSIPYGVRTPLMSLSQEPLCVYPTFTYVGDMEKKFAASRVTFVQTELFLRYSRMKPEDQEKFLSPLFSLISREEAAVAYVTVPWDATRTKVMKVESDYGGLILSLA